MNIVTISSRDSLGHVANNFCLPLAIINIRDSGRKNCLYSFKNAMNYVHNEIWRHLDVIGLYMIPIMLRALLTTTCGGLLLKKKVRFRFSM